MRPDLNTRFARLIAVGRQYVGRRIAHDCGGYEIAYIAVAIGRHYGRERILARPVVGRGLRWLDIHRCRVVEDRWGEVWTAEEKELARSVGVAGFVTDGPGAKEESHAGFAIGRRSE